MKRFVALLMALGLAVTAAGCGSGQSVGSSQSALPSAPEASASVDAAQSASDAEAGASLDQQSDTVTMIYYLDLKDGSIMAACRDQSGIDSLGGDYIKVYTDNAIMEDAAGKPVALSDIARGSILQVTFPGMVTMSIPAQISASKIVVSEEAPADVPAENEIPDRGSGKWWEPEVVNQVPDLSIQYRSQYGQISQLIPYHTGSWSYGDDGAQQGGMTNAALDGQKPQDWVYDEYNTLTRAGFDTVTLTFAAAPKDITVTAYLRSDPEDPGTQIPVEADGSIALLQSDEDMVYTVSGTWNTEAYQGWAVYGFLVTAAD